MNHYYFLRRSLFSFLILIFLSIHISSSAADFYWRAVAVNNNFNNPANWETTQGGGTSPGSYPTENDDVYFVHNSNINNITIGSGTGRMRNLTITAPVMITLGVSSEGSFEIAGSIAANGNLNIISRNVKFINSPTAPSETTIDMGTTDVRKLGYYNCTFDRAGKSIKLLNHLNLNNNIVTQNTNLNSNGFNITANTFTINPSATATPATINLTNCTLTMNGIGSYYNGSLWDLLNNTLTTSTCDVINSNVSWTLCGRSAVAPPNALNTYTFRSIKLNNPTGITFKSSDGKVTRTNIVATELIVNTPAVLFTRNHPNWDAFQYITVQKLTLAQKATITIDQQVTFAHTTVFQVGEVQTTAGCLQQSTLQANTLTNFEATSPLTTNNLMYVGINFAGTNTVTAPERDNGGNNSGNVVWTTTTPIDYYWIGGNGNWDDPLHWSLTSGGVPNAAGCVPTATDNVFVDNNSFSAAGQSITLPVSVACKNITWDDATKRGSLKTANPTYVLNINGNANFSGVADNGIAPSLQFLGNGAHTITSGGNRPLYASPFIKIICNGSYTLTDDMLCTTATVTDFTHHKGTFNAGGNTLSCRSFASPKPYTRVLNLVNAKIYTSYNMWYNDIFLESEGMSSYDFSGSHFYVKGRNFVATGTNSWVFNDISFIDANANGFLNLDANKPIAINTLTFDGNGVFNTYACQPTINHLVLSPAKNYSTANFAKITINNSVDTRTNGCGLLTFTSPAGYKATIKANYSPFIMEGLIISNIRNISADTLYVPNGQDAGGNEKVKVTPATPKNFYWVGNTGNWSDASHWSIGTSGGDPATTNPGGCLPSNMDSVFFDVNSFSANNQVVTLDITPVSINTMRWTAEAGAKKPVFKPALNYTLNIYGSLEWAEGMSTMNPPSGWPIINFLGTLNSPNAQIYKTNSGIVLTQTDLIFNTTGRYDLHGEIKSNRVVEIRNGHFYSNSYPIGATYINIYQKNNFTVDIQNSTLTAYSIPIEIANCTYWNAQHAKFISTLISIKSPCDLTLDYAKVNSTLTNQTPTKSLRFKNLEMMCTNTGTTGAINGGNISADTLRLPTLNSILNIERNTTFTVNDTVIAITSPCNYAMLRSSDFLVGGVKATIKSGNCKPLDFIYFNFQNIQGDISCTADKYQVIGNNLGGNTNITFNDPPSTTIVYSDTTLYCGDLPYNFTVNVLGQVTSYQWKRNGTIISGATTNSINITETGNYHLDVVFAGTACINEYSRNFTAIFDNKAPTVTCKADTTIYLDSTHCSYPITTTIHDANITDECNIDKIWFTLSGATTAGPIYRNTLVGQTLNKGITTVTWFANDIIIPPSTTANQASCSMNIQVLDTIKPKLTCKNDTVISIAGNTLTTNLLNPIINEACPYTAVAQLSGATSGTYHVAPFDITLNQGTTNIKWTVTDDSGNTSECSFNVTLSKLVFTVTNINHNQCFVNSEGYLTINASGGIAPYLYSIDDGATWHNNNVFTTLPSANYLIKVKDANGVIQNMGN